MMGTEPLTSGGTDVVGRMKGIFAEPESATKEVLATQQDERLLDYARRLDVMK